MNNFSLRFAALALVFGLQACAADGTFTGFNTLTTQGSAIELSDSDSAMIAEDLTQNLHAYVRPDEPLILAVSGDSFAAAFEERLRSMGYSVELGSVGDGDNEAQQVRYQVALVEEGTSYARLIVGQAYEASRLYSVGLDGSLEAQSPISIRTMDDPSESEAENDR